MDSSSNNKDSNETQRVLVLQGGGALGAYEAGVYDVLYYWIKKDQDITNHLDKHNIFDIVAGTSIGAINAANISQLCQGKQWFMGRVCAETLGFLGVRLFHSRSN